MTEQTAAGEPSADAVDQTISMLLEKAVVLGASDVHFEPRERGVAVRFRVDSLLQDAARLPLAALGAVVANLKTRTGLDATETQRPQEGSFDFPAGELDIRVTLASMPTINGERLSLHLYTQQERSISLESLGYWGDMLTCVRGALAEPQGLLLVASPNQAAANKALLGLVHLVNDPAINIVTIEEPIEYRIAGVTQTRVDPLQGISYNTGLQAVLKQGPNVVMISSVHEREVADLALHASAHGRLILGGMHANSAAHGIVRLSQLGDPHTVAATLKVVMGQRFVRQLCAHCREAYKPDEKARKQLQHVMKLGRIDSLSALHNLEQQAMSAGIGAESPDSLSTTPTSIKQLWRASRDGCQYCNFSGYSGHIGICEVLLNSDATKQLIAGRPSTAALQQLAISEGMRPLELDALIKTLRGLASLDSISTLAA